MSYKSDYTQIAAQEMKEDRTFEEFTSAYGLHYVRGFTRCPFHSERTGSFKAYGTRGCCYGCGWKGDIYDFVETMFALDYASAVRKVAHDFGYRYHFPRSRGFHDTREYKEVRARAAAARAKHAEEQKQHELLKNRHDALISELIKYDQWKSDFRPESPDDFSGEKYDRYCEAVTNMDHIKSELDALEGEMYRMRCAELEEGRAERSTADWVLKMQKDRRFNSNVD